MNEEKTIDEGFGGHPEAPLNDVETSNETNLSADEQTSPPATPEVLNDISERLSNKDADLEDKMSSDPKEGDNLPFDMASLSREQIQTLQSMLTATPEAQIKSKKNPFITLRKYDGKLIVDFGNCRMGTTRDRQTGKDVDRQFIPALFQGDKEMTNILYSDFINSERVNCEIIDHKTKDTPYVEGETVSREEGKLVEMERIVKEWWFTIQLPKEFGGGTLQIEGRIANG